MLAIAVGGDDDFKVGMLLEQFLEAGLQGMTFAVVLRIGNHFKDGLLGDRLEFGLVIRSRAIINNEEMIEVALLEGLQEREDLVIGLVNRD